MRPDDHTNRASTIMCLISVRVLACQNIQICFFILSNEALLIRPKMEIICLHDTLTQLSLIAAKQTILMRQRRIAKRPTQE